MNTVLPLVEEVAWEGWGGWRDVEADVWVEAVALRRGGWSESRWRQWLGLVGGEVTNRRDFGVLLSQWTLARWGGVWGGRNSQEEAVWAAMRDEEVHRRLWWNWDMRTQGWGNDAGAWLQLWAARFLEWDLEEAVGEMQSVLDEPITIGR